LEETSAGGLTDFYVAGGTVPLESPSYVERGADRALLEALSAGKFCYVLNSRQMGKSSLCVRTMARLNMAGVRSAFVDLTKIGGKNVTPDQWYAGLVVEVGRALGCRAEMLRNWQEERDVSPMQRFFSALRDVALEKIDAPIVVFIDEIDATRSLPFSAGEFFAGIRECYNRRVHDIEYKRLTFCLLGVAVPGDLIADSTTTPFNIGERVVLADFTESEAAALLPGLGSGESDVLRRILYWTHGHPFLTQSLAATAAARGDVRSASDVDRLAEELLFQAKARETNINLADVGNRILNGYTDPDQIAKYRADVLSLYERVLTGQEVFDDESNRLAAVLKLSGIVRVEDRKLKVRNRIYEHVFDRHWIRENMPGAELRRQRRAFLKGALRTGLVAAVIVAVIAWLAVTATRERDRANYEVYVATMNLMHSTWEQNNLDRLKELLEATKDNPARGWEWDYWNRMAHLEVATFPRRLTAATLALYASDGKLYISTEGRLLQYSPDTGQIVDLMPLMGPAANLAAVVGNKWLLEGDGIRSAQVIDLPNRRRLAKLEDIFLAGFTSISPDGRWVVGYPANDVALGNVGLKAALWDTESGVSKSLPTPPFSGQIALSPDGKMMASGEPDTSSGTTHVRTVVREFGTWKILATFETMGPKNALRFSPNSALLATSSATGWIQLWDLKSGKEISRTHASEGSIGYMEFSSDGQWLTASGLDRVGRLYDVSRPPMKLLEAFPNVGGLLIAPDKTRVAAVYTPGTIRFYDPRTYVETPTARSGLERADDTDVLSKKAFARVQSGNRAYELDPLTGQSREMTWFAGKLLGIPASGQSWGLTERNDGSFEIVDFDTHQPVLTIPKKEKHLLGHMQFPDSRSVGLFYGDQSLEVWNVKAASLIKELHFPEFGNFRVSPDGRWMAGSSTGHGLSVWDTSTWTERSLTGVVGIYLNLAGFSPDGARFLVTTLNNTIEVWDIHAGKLAGTLSGHSQLPNLAAYSPDGRRIVSTGDDGTVRIWDAATFRELSTLTKQNEAVWSVRFTDDGGSIVTADEKGNARIWLTKTPKGLVAPLDGAK
jgi:WD40 repeat protein